MYAVYELVGDIAKLVKDGFNTYLEAMKWLERNGKDLSKYVAIKAGKNPPDKIV